MGLPQSFLTRFSRVFVEEMDEEDMRDIAAEAFASAAHRPGQAPASGPGPGPGPGPGAADAADTGAMVVSEASLPSLAPSLTGALVVSEPSLPALAQALAQAQAPALARYIPRMVAFVRRLQDDVVGQVRRWPVGTGPCPLLSPAVLCCPLVPWPLYSDLAPI